MSNKHWRSAAWNDGVDGEELLPLINDDAPVIRVSAGPGTGKTFGLVRRVVRLLHRDGLNTQGGDVLVVAFNRVIAAQLLVEISTALSEQSIGKAPRISTVHALCLSVLGEKHRLLLPHEWDAMIYDIIEDPTVRRTHHKWRDACQAFREHEARHGDHPQLWAAGRRWLEKHGANLVGDMPDELARRLQLGDFPTERYGHVIADEFQDLTKAEQDLVARLRKPSGQMVALGDARQSIYAFRGNDREGLARIEDLYPGEPVQDVPLRECRRCPDGVVAAANRLMALDVPMQSVTDAKADIHVVHWKLPEGEAKGMAKHILANMELSEDERHLVMVTRRAFGYSLRREMKALDDTIDIDLDFSESILEYWPVREAFLWFCLLVDPRSANVAGVARISTIREWKGIQGAEAQ